MKDLNNQEDDLIATNHALEELAEEKTEAMANKRALQVQTAAEATKLREEQVQESYMCEY